MSKSLNDSDDDIICLDGPEIKKNSVVCNRGVIPKVTPITRAGPLCSKPKSKPLCNDSTKNCSQVKREISGQFMFFEFLNCIQSSNALNGPKKLNTIDMLKKAFSKVPKDYIDSKAFSSMMQDHIAVIKRHSNIMDHSIFKCIWYTFMDLHMNTVDMGGKVGDLKEITVPEEQDTVNCDIVSSVNGFGVTKKTVGSSKFFKDSGNIKKSAEETGINVANGKFACMNGTGDVLTKSNVIPLSCPSQFLPQQREPTKRKCSSDSLSSTSKRAKEVRTCAGSDASANKPDAQLPFVVDKEREAKIEKLTTLLKRLHKTHQKLSLRDLGLDEMDDDDSTYLRMGKISDKIMKVHHMICKLSNSSKKTGLQSERRIRYPGTRWPELNKAIEDMLNKNRLKQFPEYLDIHELVENGNRKYSLGMPADSINHYAAKIFEDVGREMKKRRIFDSKDSLVGYIGEECFEQAVNSDPADADEELLQNLERSATQGQQRIQSVIDEFVTKQKISGEDSANPPQQSDESEEESEEEVEDNNNLMNVLKENDKSEEESGGNGPSNLKDSENKSETEPSSPDSVTM